MKLVLLQDLNFNWTKRKNYLKSPLSRNGEFSGLIETSVLCMIWVNTQNYNRKFNKNIYIYIERTFWLISMNCTYASSLGRRKTTAVPWLPIRAVRPHRWTNAAALDGASNCRTQSISVISIPRAITSVQTRTPDSSCRNWSKILWRVCFILPWIHNTFMGFKSLPEEKEGLDNDFWKLSL